MTTARLSIPAVRVSIYAVVMVWADKSCIAETHLEREMDDARMCRIALLYSVQIRFSLVYVFWLTCYSAVISLYGDSLYGNLYVMTIYKHIRISRNTAHTLSRNCAKTSVAGSRVGGRSRLISYARPYRYRHKGHNIQTPLHNHLRCSTICHGDRFIADL